MHIAIDEKVSKFDIPMDYVHRVNVYQALYYLPCKVPDLDLVEPLPAPNDLRQALVFAKIH